MPAGHGLSLEYDAGPHGPQDFVPSPSPSPPFTGPLERTILEEIGNTACQLLDLLSSFRFRKLAFSRHRVENLLRVCNWSWWEGALMLLDVSMPAVTCALALALRWSCDLP